MKTFSVLAMCRFIGAISATPLSVQDRISAYAFESR